LATRGGLYYKHSAKSMGKRELLLIGVFLFIGIGVYQVTAPAPKPGEQGFSIGRLFNAIKTEVHGENAEARVTRQAQQALEPAVTSLLVPDFRGVVIVIGEPRTDVTAELQASAFGLDDETAQTRAKAIALSLETAGAQMTVGIARPTEGRRARTTELKLRVPARLACSLEFRGEAEVRGVAEVRLLAARGKALIRDVGLVHGEMSNGEMEVFNAREVELKTQRSQVRIDRVEKSLALEAVHGQVRVQRVGGDATLRFERLSAEAEAIAGHVTVQAEYGDFKLRDIVAPVEITGDRTGLELIMRDAVAVSASTRGDGLMVELPKEGVTLDAMAEDGRVRMPDRDVAVKSGDRKEQVTMNIRGGGPTVRLRNEHADIVIRNGGDVRDTAERR
jgi:hypothetical protein